MHCTLEYTKGWGIADIVFQVEVFHVVQDLRYPSFDAVYFTCALLLTVIRDGRGCLLCQHMEHQCRGRTLLIYSKAASP